MSEPLFKTFNELLQYTLKYLPDAQIGEDNDGQLVIYTNLYETDEGLLAEYDTEMDADKKETLWPRSV